MIARISLVEMEEEENQAKPARWMFGIDAAANRRSEIADDCFCDSVHTDGIVMAQRILQNADRAS